MANLIGFSPNGNKLATLQSGSSSMSVSRPVFPDPFPNFDDWLDSNPNDYLGELTNEYKNYPNVTAGIGRSFRNAIDYTKSVGGQIAGNAATEAMTRWAQSGGGGNSGMVKAQAMLPVYEQVGKLTTDRGMAMAAATQKGAEVKANLAAEMGRMRMTYLMQMIQSRIAAAGHDQFQNNDQYTYGGSGDGTVGMSTSGGSERPRLPFEGQITRAPNNSGMGGVEYTPEWLAYLSANGLSSGPAPQYPRTAGVGSGGDLDAYMAQLRGNFSLANGKPAYNQVVDQQAGLDTSSYEAARNKMQGTPQQQNNKSNVKAAAQNWLKKFATMF